MNGGTDEGARQGFAEWWAQRRVASVLNPRGFAQMVWAAAVVATLRRVAVTVDEAGAVVAVVLTSDDGRHVRVLWERTTPAASAAAQEGCGRC